MPKIDEQNINVNAGSLHYPNDLGVGFTHPDCVKFTIGTNPGVSLRPVTDKIKSRVFAAKKASIDASKKLLAELTDEKTRLEELSTRTEPQKQRIETISARLNQNDIQKNINRSGKDSANVSDLGNAVVGAVGNIKGTAVDILDGLAEGAESNVFTAEKTIYLPMPENLVYNEPVDWTGTELGAMKTLGDMATGGEAGKGALGGAALSQAGNVLAGGTGAIVSKLLGGGLLGGAVLGGLGGGAALQGVIESKLRIKSNPFKEQTFQGVGFRPFEFSFVFNARSQSEVLTIKDIINTFRKYSKPSLDSPDSAIFRYPGEFIIEFKTLDHEIGTWYDNEYLPRLKHCICKSVNTNFTTAGWKSFEEGAPTTITLQLGFEEIDIITAEQIQEGY